MSNAEEVEANIFAAYLLVPSSLLRQEVAAMKGRIDLTDDAGVAELADKFQVSIALMTMRLLEEFGKAKKVWE